MMLTALWQTAKAKGLYTTNITLPTFIKGLQYSPIEDTLPTDLQGSIVIIYRYDCSDCHAVYNDLKNSTEDNTNIYWISSRSEQGQELVKHCKVDEVPMGIYFYNKDNPEFVRYPLYKINSYTLETELYSKNLDRLLLLQEQQR